MQKIDGIAQTAAAFHQAETQRLEAEKKRIQAEAEQAARAAAAKPLAKVEAEHAANQKKLNQLTDLTTRREILVDQIKVAKIDVAQQTELAAELARRWEYNFGRHHLDIERLNPHAGAYGDAVRDRLDLLCAPMVLPRLQAWLEARQSDLENVEAEIVAYDNAAK